jgi:hypothetical protein
MSSNIVIPPHSQLITYHPVQQHNGLFLQGFDWTLYGTGTFRRVVSEDNASLLLDRFATKLSRAMKFRKGDLAYFGVLEDQFPGVCATRNHMPVRRHWHFLMACPEHPLLISVAQQLWLDNGLCQIKHYDPTRDAAFYMSKLTESGAYTRERNMERLEYHGNSDLLETCNASSYVPQCLADKTTGEYLVLRDVGRHDGTHVQSSRPHGEAC